MNGDRIKLLYEKIKNTTNKIDKQNLLVELGDVIVTYSSDKATKLDFIVMYCASVERADPHVVDFILKYDYKKTPSYFNKTWGFFSKFTKVASQAQNAFSSFETLTSGNELDEILKKIEEEKKKEKPDNDYLEVLDNQKDQVLLNTGNNFFIYGKFGISCSWYRVTSGGIF